MLDDTRGQAIEIGWGFAVLIAISLLYGFMKTFFSEMKATFDEHTTVAATQTGLDWTATIFQNFLIIATFISVLGVIAVSVYKGRV